MGQQTVKHVLEWKELTQTIMTLNLSIAQIDLSMTEGSYSVDTLIDSFNFMREGLATLNQTILNDEVSDIAELKANLIEQSKVMSDKVVASIIAFQFYDKLSQRLQHVSKSLSSLADIISHEDRTVDETMWNSFRDKMAKYAAMREEYELFELIFKQGMSSEAAIEVMKGRMRQRLEEAQAKHAANGGLSDDDDDIELF